MANTVTDFSIAPYFDDYDENKQYYKVLFRPSVAVQARELNQMQTMVQKQIERFGQHIFREGSLVIGGAFDLEMDVAYVKAVSFAPTNISGYDFVGRTVIGVNSRVTAFVRAYDFDLDNNVHVFFIRYLNAGNTTNLYSDKFIDGEQIQDVNDANYYFVAQDKVGANVQDSTGFGSIFSIEQGVVFTKGYFVAFPKQTVVLERYSKRPTKSIGLRVTESFVSELNDTSLLDNALGSYNENAPGAHRYYLNTTLVAIEYGTGNLDNTFLSLMDIKDGVVQEKKERSQYARVYDELAKRTYDESGDYYVNGFGLRTREHLDTGSNEGLYTANGGGDPTLLSIDVEPGVGYVKGYEVNKLVTSHVITTKSTDFKTVNGQYLNTSTGGYFLIKEIVGSPKLDSGTIVDLYNTAETRITSTIKSSVTPTGTKIGTARVKSLIYETGTLGQPSATMRLYLYDINITTGILSDVRGVGVLNEFFADIIVSPGSTNFIDQNENVLLFPVGSNYTKTIRDTGGTPDTSFEFSRTEDVLIDFDVGGGVLTVDVTTTSEAFPYTSGNLSTAQKRELILSISSDKDIKLSTTASGTAGSSTINGDADIVKLSVGDRIKVNGSYYTVTGKPSPISISVTPNLVTSFTNVDIFRSYLTGDLIDLTSAGSSGSVRTASINAGILSIDLKEDLSNVTPNESVSGKLSYRVVRSGAFEIKKVLKPNVFVKIDCSTHPNGANGPYSLGLPDIYKIRSIRMHNSDFTSNTQGVDVTSSFTLDNGQRDSFYDHGRIKKTSNINLTNQWLLVEFDYFDADFTKGFGFFSVDSYPIDDTQVSDTTMFTYQIPKYKTQAGKVYDLRNTLDFRPLKFDTAVSSTFVSSATINPTETTVLQNYDNNGLRTPVPDTNVIVDYSYYLARRDIVTLDKEGNFNVIKGEPAISPVSPSVPDNVMGVGNVYIAPYPSVSETLARIIGEPKIGCVSRKIANVRYTMREIGVLKNRIESLEYYNALTLLEKSAVEMRVTDENGLDRFKNGFFVDGFLDHSLGATYNPDYKVSVDKVEQCIRPIFEVNSFPYQAVSTAGTVNVANNLVMLPYTEVTLVEQKHATSRRNIEQGVFRFIGTMELTPDGDNWCDTKTVDKTFEFGNELPSDATMSTEWGSWQTYSTGYNVYDRAYGDRTGVVDPNLLLGTYTSYAAAVAASQNTPYLTSTGVQKGTDNRALIETVVTEQRKGIQTTVNYETQVTALGNFVTDVSLATYIRPQVIKAYIKGLKANTKFWLFFDGEDMSDYCAQQDIAKGLFSAEGSQLRSDEFGELMVYIRLPVDGKRFRVGTKEIIVTDSQTNAIDATTYAKGYFTAFGMNAAKQNTIISTKIPVIQQKEVTETRTIQTVEIMGPSCMAYSFKVEAPKGEDGVFLTSVDVWIEDKHPTLGVWFEIREMNSAGGVTRTQVPYSEVWLKSSQITTWDGDPATENSNKTKITFPAPVFLMNNTQYCFVIHTEGLNPDYYFWVSRLGETDIITKQQVTGRQLTGTLFTTNNNLNYDMVPDVDLKVRFNRADFTPGTGTVTLGNKPIEFVNLKPGAGSFIRTGETIRGSQKLTFTGLAGVDTIGVGDYIATYNSTTNTVTNSAVIEIVGSFYSTNGTGYATSQAITVYAANGVTKSITGTIQSIDGGVGILREYNSANNIMIIENSNGRFFPNCLIRGESSNNVGYIDTFDTFDYSTTNLKPHYLIFNQTACTFEKRGYIAKDNRFGNWLPGYPDGSSDFDNEKAILSRYNENLILGGTPSAQARATLISTSRYVSPVLDLNRANCVYVHNIINSNTVGEDGVTGGGLINKYISKTVTLAEGQDAEDLLVKLTAYKPPGTDVKVWYKIRNGEDGQALEDRPWVEMSYNETVFSSIINKSNFIEFDYSIPEANKNTNGIVSYTTNGITYSSFKQYAIKIGLIGDNSALVPRVGDLRVIALQL